MRAGRTIALSPRSAVTACALAPQPPRRRGDEAGAAERATARAVGSARRRRGGVADNWLATFRDAGARCARHRGVAYNADLRIAAARVDAAAAYLAASNRRCGRR
jgi:outer membrane protein TolC